MLDWILNIFSSSNIQMNLTSNLPDNNTTPNTNILIYVV